MVPRPPVRTEFQRKPSRRLVPRSFRIPPQLDRSLGAAARKAGKTKSALIKDILVGWVEFQQARARVDLDNIEL